MDNGNSVVTRGIDVRNGDFFSVDKKTSLFRVIDSAKDFDQCGFSRAIFTQKSVNLSGF